jgi:hypothetical protein
MLISRRRFGWSAAALGLVASGAARAARVGTDWPNVFISPMGQPFRAKPGAPYPVVDWFKQVDKDADGKIDHGEFMADAEAFFKVLDRNGDGVIDNYEVAIYEHNIAPEVLGFTVAVSDLGAVARFGGARLWKAQISEPNLGNEPPNDPTNPGEPIPTGAAPYTLVQTPEPITGADTNFDGHIRKANFLALADRRFTGLDKKGDGYLTLAGLPKTYVQERLQPKKGFHF